MNITIASDKDREKWDFLVAESPSGTLFHTLKWLECMETHTTAGLIGMHLPGKLILLVFREGSTIVALFPLFLYSGPSVRMIKSGSYDDDTIYLGPVFMDTDSIQPAKLQLRALRLQQALDQYIRKKLKANIVTLRMSPFITDARPYIWTGYDVELSHTYVFDLLQGVDPVWLGFHGGIRKNIRNARNRGISVERGGLEDALFIYDTLAARGRTNSSRAFVMEIVRAFSPDNCSVFIAKQDGRRISGKIVLFFKDRAYFWIGAPGMVGDDRGTNELITWEVIRWAHASGFHFLESMGADDITTFPYKRKFNARLEPYFTVFWASFLFRSYRYLKRLTSSHHHQTVEEKNREEELLGSSDQDQADNG
jgi:hypothetical protein